MEKERALAEETQATLAALDAMRKAHEAEVQREIGRFKEEYLSQTVLRHDKNAASHKHEKELQEIRREILSLSEKYSDKCLESAALEQKVSTLGQQVLLECYQRCCISTTLIKAIDVFLMFFFFNVMEKVSVAQRQIHDLDARNQQLRSFLDGVDGSNDAVEQPDSTPGQMLKAKDSQLLLLQEDVAELQFCLRESQSREEELATLARQLGQYLRTERPLRPVSKFSSFFFFTLVLYLIEFQFSATNRHQFK